MNITIQINNDQDAWGKPKRGIHATLIASKPMSTEAALLALVANGFNLQALKGPPKTDLTFYQATGEGTNKHDFFAVYGSPPPKPEPLKTAPAISEVVE